jgi:membrane fusion protein (multidrug efflux system)
VAVYFSVSENEYLNYIRRKTHQEAGRSGKASDVVELVLADGAVYPEKGRIDYMDPTVNPTTGTLTLRAIFHNQDYLLKAGMNSRVRVYYDEIEAAILVPQKAVTETLGKTFVTVVGTGDKAELRPVQLGPRMGEQWLVESGLSDGETIVVEGVQKARSGMTVTPVPLHPPDM